MVDFGVHPELARLTHPSAPTKAVRKSTSLCRIASRSTIKRHLPNGFLGMGSRRGALHPAGPSWHYPAEAPSRTRPKQQKSTSPYRGASWGTIRRHLPSGSARSGLQAWRAGLGRPVMVGRERRPALIQIIFPKLALEISITKSYAPDNPSVSDNFLLHHKRSPQNGGI